MHRLTIFSSHPLTVIVPIVSVVALTLLATPAVGIPYTFTNIAYFDGPFQGVGSRPSLNASGTVAFFGLLNGGVPGIYKGSGGPVTTIADLRGGYGSVSMNPSINAAGTVVWVSGISPNGSGGVFSGNGGPVTILYQGSNPVVESFGSDGPSVNDSGTVAFEARRHASAGGGSGIFSGNGGPLTTIALSNDLFGGLTEAPSINNSGTVALHAFHDRPEGIYRGNGGALTTIADVNGPFSDFLSSDPAINDSGTVAFRASLDAGGEGIFTSNNGITFTTIADNLGPYATFGPIDNAPSINSSGVVAFFARLDGGGAGIFTGPNPVADKVIRNGDPLDGSTALGGFNFFHGALNDNGQIAFYATLANGKAGIFRADPAVITTAPEPGILTLLIIGMLGLALYGWRRQKSSPTQPSPGDGSAHPERMALSLNRRLRQ